MSAESVVQALSELFSAYGADGNDRRAAKDVGEKLVKLGMQVAAGNAEALATRIREDVARYARIIKQTGIRAD